MPPVIASILAFVQLALKAAPTVEQVYNDAHDLIDAMFASKLLTKEQQAAAHKWVDDHEEQVLANVKAGTLPPEMQVMPNAPEQTAATVAPDKSQAILDTLNTVLTTVTAIHELAKPPVPTPPAEVAAPVATDANATAAPAPVAAEPTPA